MFSDLHMGVIPRNGGSEGRAFAGGTEELRGKQVPRRFPPLNDITEKIFK